LRIETNLIDIIDKAANVCTSGDLKLFNLGSLLIVHKASGRHVHLRPSDNKLTIFAADKCENTAQYFTFETSGAGYYFIKSLYSGQVLTVQKYKEEKIEIDLKDQPCSFGCYNHTDATIDVFWVNFENVEVLYLSILPGMMYQQPSYTGHSWVARSAGTKVSEYSVSKKKRMAREHFYTKISVLSRPE